MPDMKERDSLLRVDAHVAGQLEALSEKPRTNRRRAIYMCIALLALSVLVAIGGSLGAASNRDSPSSVGIVKRQSDPSVFAPDSALHHSFYAIAYETPGGRLYPNCNDTLDAVVTQIQLLSQLTSRLRTYGADCNQTWLIQEAINVTKVNMSVFLGVYMDSDPSVYERQIEQTIAVLKQFGTKNVLGVQVGNEYILDSVTAGGNASLAPAQALVLQNVQDTKKRLAAAGFPNVPVGSGDAGEYCSASYAAGLDFTMCNSHPFFAGVTIQQAPEWAFSYFDDSTPSALAGGALSTNSTIWSGEVGWPSNAIAFQGGTQLNGSVASVANMQYFLDNFVCAANANTTANSSYPVLGTAAAPKSLPYVWFSAFDLYINYEYGGAEPFWGLFDESNTLKAITIPDCIIA